MTGISQLRHLNRNDAVVVAAAFVAVGLLVGCRSVPPMRLHYLPGFVPGSERIFRPARIAVLAANGEIAQGRVRVGGVYAADGSLDRPLYVQDFGRSVDDALMTAFAGAGLKPVASATLSSGAASLPVGIDFMLVTTIEAASIDKRYGVDETVHGQTFTMKASVRLKFTLASRASPNLYTGEMIGTEEEPPVPVGKEVFLPLETDPQESMSVALSRAVGALMLQSGFRDALPVLLLPSPAPRHR